MLLPVGHHGCRAAAFKLVKPNSPIGRHDIGTTSGGTASGELLPRNLSTVVIDDHVGDAGSNITLHDRISKYQSGRTLDWPEQCG
jgi:hypothetical protein